MNQEKLPDSVSHVVVGADVCQCSSNSDESKISGKSKRNRRVTGYKSKWAQDAKRKKMNNSILLGVAGGLLYLGIKIYIRSVRT
ncbi:hypothetical protein [Haliscomenobacter hydrossis]|uniref:Uncharacterized protein n=1 Tax=Haliscomenobacter hydrossis (strain ATCC 27775 / DSM 1100 / LMG 10767 / O) TaxID=760192 RepID=F4L5R3_HALH1|nr:hypothetical protein [Haliscomenobacter hydrossis]AEE51898.1 hypothetical protein Halhy_4050 [Haliscomenobacter hydrossis DSM 1100]